ncbi:carboxypeptidase, partial [Vibrio anguillarum]|nr:carboxypeptidase [Vibrio anguillarum]
MHRFALSASYITNQTDGSFGYFPSYTLGAMYAAQFMAAMKKTVDVDSVIKSGN